MSANLVLAVAVIYAGAFVSAILEGQNPWWILVLGSWSVGCLGMAMIGMK